VTKPSSLWEGANEPKELIMNAQQRIAVTGATGRLGSRVVEVLASSGHDVIPISRSKGVDVITGDGLEEALAGVDTVIDTATGPSPDKESATQFFLTAARNLHDAGEQAGVRRIVLVSIIGCDRFSGGYNVAKVAQERAHLDGPIPAQILRAAQFHEFVGQLLEWGTQGDVADVPAMRTQLVAARNVAEALADLAITSDAAEPGSPIPEIAGPRVERLLDAARLLATRRGSPAQVEETSDPNEPDRDLYAGDGLLPGPHATLAGPTFEQWLESRAAVETVAGVTELTS
jgi:uncharacterized protein YbjT (DUF2867 family)